MFADSNVVYGSGFADKIYKASMKNVRGVENLFPGEKHAPLLMPDGKTTVGNFIGPGTKAVERIHRGDRGITPVDDLAMRHDALYSLAKTKKDIRDADRDFLNILKKGVVKDKSINIMTGQKGISSKYKAETLTGVRFPTKKELDANDPNDEKLLDVVRMTDKMYGVQSGKGFFSDDFVRRAVEHGKRKKAMQYGNGFRDLFTKYHKISKNLGVKPEDVIKQIKEKAKEKGLIQGSGAVQSGDGFWDFLSVLSVLPIPFFSDVARTVSLIATPIRVAVGDFTPALDGIVTDTMKEITAIFPKSIQETILNPSIGLAESVGFGLKRSGEGLKRSGEGLYQDGGRAPTPMEKVKLLYHIHKKVNEVKDKINKLPPEQAKKVLDMGRKSKEVADYVMKQMRLPTLEQIEESKKK